MHLSLTLAGAFAVTAAVSVDFPPPDKLPSNPGLPDPTVMFDGTKVTTKADWEAKRRPELKALFEHYMYGRYPAKPDKVTAVAEIADRSYGEMSKLRGSGTEIPASCCSGVGAP